MLRTNHRLLQLVEGSWMHGCPLPFEICFQHHGERSRYSLEFFDKLLVKSTQPDKLSNFMDGGLCRPTSNYLDLFGVHVYAVFIDDVSPKRPSGLEKRLFVDRGQQLVLL